MKIGFAKKKLTEFIIPDNRPAQNTASANPEHYRREVKFDITDRVKGLWRPDEGGSRKVVEDIYATALIAEDGKGPFLLIAIDQCLMTYTMLDLLTAPIVQELKIAKERIIIMPSHVHINVTFDLDKLQQAMLSMAQSAMENAEDAEMAPLHIQVDEKRYTINRRVHLDGVGTRTVMFNDGCDIKDDCLDVTEQVREWIKNLGGEPDRFIPAGKRIATHGETDPYLQALLFRSAATKKMLGTFVRFAAHPVIVSEKKANGDISADYPGHLRDKLDARFGGLTVFGQGNCGEIRPLNREYSHAFAKEYGVRLAEEVIAAASAAQWQPLTVVGFDEEKAFLPLRKDLPLSQEDANSAMDRIEAEFDKETNIEKRRKLQNLFWLYYRGHDVKKMLRPEWIKKNTIEAHLFAARFNDDVLLFNQGEAFNSTMRKMVAPFPAPRPITVSICNEEISYLPSREDFEKGGYEPSVCLAEPGSSETIFVEKARVLLTRIRK